MKIASNKIKDVLRFFREELSDSYGKDELDSIIAYCFEAFLKMNRASLMIKIEETVSESELLKFNFAIKDLKQHIPIQYILGEADFYGLKFRVNSHVLIPRPETEELVHLVLNESKKKMTDRNDFSILDIGTGSGCIPIALKKNMSSAQLFAMDISEQALEVAKSNAQLNGVEVKFIHHDILGSIPNDQQEINKFDVIVSNPPYICFSEKEQMDKNVLDNEPHLALFVNDADPLIFYKAICDFAIKKLKNNGQIYFEINQKYGLETKNLLENKGFKNVELIKDLSHNNRILRGNI